jgi:peptidoglycan/xylan/chitin deacetylase (PgdA/CDA1 family)
MGCVSGAAFADRRYSPRIPEPDSLLLTILDRVLGHGAALAYHGVTPDAVSPELHISPERFADHLEYLSSRYRILPLRELIDRIERRRSIRSCVAITFVDAYRGVYRYAAPILREHDAHATVFACSDYAERGDVYWWDALEMVRQAGGAPWHAVATSLGHAGADASLESALMLRTSILAEHQGRFRVPPLGESIVADDLHPLSWSELRDITADGRIDVACHTASHPCLLTLSEAEQRAEIGQCSEELRSRLAHSEPLLAYPYGAYDESSIRAARFVGMRAAVTTASIALSPRSPSFELPRVGAMENRSVGSLSLRLSAMLRPMLRYRDRKAMRSLTTRPSPQETLA